MMAKSGFALQLAHAGEIKEIWRTLRWQNK
jgi:hypothetical protein